MSFLDSVLSSIGTGASTTSNPAKSSADITTPVIKSDVSTNLSVKRKAEEDLRRPPDKTLKVERTISTTKSTERLIKPLPVARQNGTSPTAAPTAPEPAQASSKNPKKGSFAAIMARAKEAQAQPTSSAGSITHKPKDKVKTKTRKELIMEREAAKKAAKKGIPFTGLASNKDGISKDLKKSMPERPNSATKRAGDQSTSKPPEKSGYQGTMQSSSTPRYTGTARPQTSANKATSNSRDSGHMKSNQAAKQRRHYDESDEDESEDGYDYASEDYSDMDAGFDDMENEEEQAAKIARKEDAEAQAELDRLKREKDRKKMLLAKGKR